MHVRVFSEYSDIPIRTNLVFPERNTRFEARERKGTLTSILNFHDVDPLRAVLHTPSSLVGATLWHPDGKELLDTRSSDVLDIQKVQTTSFRAFPRAISVIVPMRIPRDNNSMPRTARLPYQVLPALCIAILQSLQHDRMAFAEVSTQPIADRIEQVTFDSKALGARKHFCVVLPGGYDADTKDWPVLYLLHGRGRNDRSLIDHPPARDVLLNAPFVTVLPNGEDGWYLDSPVLPNHRYLELLKETISVAEEKYRLSRDPSRRGITGWSMGAYGCMRHAVANPNTFSYVATMIGLLDFPRSGLPEGQTYKVPTKYFGTDETEWRSLNPITDAEKLRGSKILLITADEAFDRTMNESMHKRLQELKIEHDWTVFKGGHKFDVVVAALPTVTAGFESVLRNNRVLPK
jgi:S-formylglutathione hydrolase FrmB